MNSQTTRRPDQQRSTRDPKAKTRKYSKQTAHVEARRDGKPLIFGWGAHLSRSEKIRIQRRAIWSLAILMTAAIIGVVVFFWINITILIPNQPITSVNGQNIPQSDYHKLVVFKSQWELNALKSLQLQSSDLSTNVAKQQSIIDDTQKKIDDYTNKLKTATGDQKTSLQTQLDDAKATQKAAQTKHDDYNKKYSDLQTNGIPNQQARYTQSQLSGETANWLQEDVLINNWLKTQSSAVQQKVEPTQQQLDRAVQDFKNQIAKTTSNSNNYDAFLKQYSMSDNDMRTMMKLKLRRDNMNTYLRDLYVSPSRQVHVSSITAATEKDAKDLINQLKGKSLDDFAKVAKAKSQDTNTKDKGGDLGWLVPGQYTADYSSKLSGTIDNWIFDSRRTVGEVSPVLLENGSYRVIRIDEMSASRNVDKATLDKMRDASTPIDVWVQSQRSQPGMNITSPDQEKMFSTLNMPQEIPYSPPTSTPSATS
jgi:parvulin-like peptidyl-prolyl isomerase